MEHKIVKRDVALTPRGAGLGALPADEVDTYIASLLAEKWEIYQSSIVQHPSDGYMTIVWLMRRSKK